MKELKLIDRVVVEVMDAVCDDCPNSYVAAKLREVADLIESCVKGGDLAKIENFDQEVLWEHEMKRYGGFKMGTQSLIRDAYYGAKEFFEVCSLSKEDIEAEGFDASELDDDDMARIADKMGDLIHDVEYCYALRGACEYWNVPRKDDIDDKRLTDSQAKELGY